MSSPPVQPAVRLSFSVVQLASAGAAAAVILQVWRVMRALRTSRAARSNAQAFDRRTHAGDARVLVLGDSTAVGVGADRPADSIAGLLAAEFGSVGIVNLARSGGRLVDALTAARRVRRAGGAPFDVILLLVGGNDVLHATAPRLLAAQARLLLAELAGCGRHTVWLGAANLGLSPSFVPPFSWWLSARAEAARNAFAAAAHDAGADFVDFHRDRADDVFSRDVARWYAADRVHPSSASYRYCYDALKRAVPLARWLGEGAERQRQPMRLAAA